MEDSKTTIPPLDMKDRIRQLMDEVQLNQRDFAMAIGISPSTLSSIFNGRSSATLNHALALHNNFPNIRMEWLLFGEGDMYKSAATEESGSGDAFPEKTNPDNAPAVAPTQGGLPFAQSTGSNTPQSRLSPEMSSEILTRLDTLSMEIKTVKNDDKPMRQISEIRIFFDDGTFQVFSPKDTPTPPPAH